MTIVLPPGQEYDDSFGEIGPCPGCGAPLRRWGYGRWRVIRDHVASRRVRPRRVRCSGCQVTHVVLPPDLLVRRRDGVATVGQAWRGFAVGIGARRMARRLEVPMETARGWLRRLRTVASRAPGGPAGTGPDQLARELEHQAAAARAAGWHGEVDLWRYVAYRSQGLLLANTS